MKRILLAFLLALIAVASIVTVGWLSFPREAFADYRERGVPILMYHKVNPDPKTGGLGLRVLPREFDWQMHYLKEHGFHTVSLDEAVDYLEFGKPLPEKPIVITFDDGYRDNYVYAFPILKKYGFRATIFIITGIVGKTNEWDEREGKPTNYMLTWKQIDEMANYGIEFGAHTVNHPRLTKVPLEVAEKEIFNSKKMLEAHFKRPVKYFCYPYGLYNDQIVEIVKKAGFRAATTTQLGINARGCDLYRLKRLRVTGHMSRRQFVEQLEKYLREMT
ncbi:polysaccharide deacetylase family protein [Carboxydothermus ferrireducens]|uniref:Peptidoglycan/xylan/chitin deacetylase (PgdA/CDA1 family) n=1 Tax=Carboxydothermus ferrireducens DSM 11255 TaxID=1119529 RepID=A0ABX2R9T5_9THEO|nr:polysaccharide deacetylase family protein [Carboxydothermus ferrireducens]NYE57322.1 peptidoglycan/xylan/chitin deacetylase (PgdA/CDA1 family) [Carboxydothermus ferrireducens DSM 11255]